ncbi:4Fe-4S binding protein [Tessaracoccus flavus]|uniref:Uncharacterized protein n=1 Tax=Tessaracoccus flavus TaxID=1610493 RepID=A0A1Q2CGJ8_9ACTN|nr:4Fe-4S binding protein [Tessaracoccus flavus]AQP45227.1 hypothetical protein RPIT_10825 [Tessaracoccus flavus]SDY52195.1 4Fe-4S dicluster domain-containing protein [Tessaracoccus flavus]
MSEASHAAILRWLDAAEPAEITLSCAESPLPGAVILDRCLAEVPAAWVAELATHCPVRAAVDHCARPEVARSRLAELASVTTAITLDGGPSSGHPVRYTHPPARRRALFGLGSTTPAPSGTLAERLAAALSRLPLTLEAESPAARLRITRDCTACGLCARSCPHGALGFAVVEGVAAIHHKLDACQGDGTCVAVCPEDAIVRDGTHRWAEVRDHPVVEVTALPVLRCGKCNAPFADNSDTPSALCPVCRVTAAEPFGVHLTPTARALLERRRRGGADTR